MSFFTLEYSELKNWLLTKIRLWGIVLPTATYALSYLLIYLFRSESKNCMDYLQLSAVCALFTFALLSVCHQLVVERKSNPTAIYFIVALLPLILLIYCICQYGLPIYGSRISVSLTMIIWLFISFFVSVWVAFYVWKYAYRNYHYDPSRFHSSLVRITNSNGTMGIYSFTKSVEAYVLTFATMLPLIAAFL